MEQLNLNPLAVTQYFINKCDADAGDSITHLKIQKLLYYVQAWGMVLTGKKFFNENFQAWAHGPVLPSVFHALKEHSYNNLAGLEVAKSLEIDNPHLETIDSVWTTYGELSAKHLEQLTHQELPWIEARGSLPLEAQSKEVIKLETMLLFYSKMQADE